MKKKTKVSTKPRFAPKAPTSPAPRPAGPPTKNPHDEAFAQIRKCPSGIPPEWAWAGLEKVSEIPIDMDDADGRGPVEIHVVGMNPDSPTYGKEGRIERQTPRSDGKALVLWTKSKKPEETPLRDTRAVSAKVCGINLRFGVNCYVIPVWGSWGAISFGPEPAPAKTRDLEAEAAAAEERRRKAREATLEERIDRYSRGARSADRMLKATGIKRKLDRSVADVTVKKAVRFEPLDLTALSCTLSRRQKLNKRVRNARARKAKRSKNDVD